MNTKKTIKFLTSPLFAITIFLILLAIALKIKQSSINRIKRNPIYTLGVVLEKIDGTGSAQYVKFKYKAKEQIFIQKQGLAVFLKNGLLNLEKGEKYLVIFNSENPKESIIVNKKLEGHLGDNYNNYSIKKLINDNYISVFAY